MALIENADPTKASLDPDLGTVAVPVEEGEEEADEGLFNETELLSFLGDAKRRSRTYQQTVVMGMWEQSEAAYRSEHGSRSKYSREQYKNRAKYFKPKTRAAVRKNMTATDLALFGSQDVIQTEAPDDGNPMAVANAALIKELLNARLNNKTMRAGLPWWQTVMGARQMTQISGVVCSKQEWRYRCIKSKGVEEVEQPYLDELGQPMLDETGQPIIEIVEVEKDYKDVTEDKPTVTLIPSEMVLIDPETNWINPAQSSPTLIVIWPMHVDDVRSMMDEEKSTTPWRAVSDEMLASALYSESELMGLKTAREGNAASTQLSKSRMGGMGHEIVEVRENFFRKGGRDYHTWTLKDQVLLSDPAPTEDVYPAHRGIRPYIIGTDALEANVLYPQSHVDSWRASQDEINDFSNIRMDGARQSVYPVAKVKAGKGIDYKAVQRRDQQGIILVREVDDVTFDRPTANVSGVDREVQLLSNDFDEIAGIFSQNSVQSNRQIGDTVGGMQMISANANATSNFDLKCFVETWVEMVLSQLIMLEQYYEDDATLLAIAGSKAKLFQKYGIDEITDELLESQVTVSIGGGGSGASDPMQKLIRFKSTFEIAQPMLVLAMQQGKAEVKFEEIFNEIFSQAGYKNGASRFIQMKEEGEEPPVPPEKIKEIMGMMQQLQQENEQLKQGAALDAGKLEIDKKKLDLDEKKLQFDVVKTLKGQEAQTEQATRDHERAFVDAGLPPGYSFEVQQEQFNAVIQELSISRETMAELVRDAQANTTMMVNEMGQQMTLLASAVVQQGQDVAQAMDRSAAASLVPKKIVTDEAGRPVGIAPAQEI